jgi:hypothetical protein
MMGAPVNNEQEAYWHGKMVNSNGQVVDSDEQPGGVINQ